MKISVQDAKKLFHAMFFNRHIILDWYGFNQYECEELEKFVKGFPIQKTETKLLQKK